MNKKRFQNPDMYLLFRYIYIVLSLEDDANMTRKLDLKIESKYIYQNIVFMINFLEDTFYDVTCDT